MKKITFFAAVALFFTQMLPTYAQLPRSIANIYSYKCTFRFFEGEGVGETSLSCLAGQHLGFYTADYDFYLYYGPNGTNFSRKGSTDLYPTSICGLQTVDRYTCGSETTPAFGLSEQRTPDFPIAVYLPSAPNQNEPSGFAAQVLANGECPSDLVKIRTFMAQPASQMYPLPSNFINRGNLNSYVVAMASSTPESFQVRRIPATEPCDYRGNCRWPNGNPSVVDEAPYSPLNPVVCAVPASELRNILPQKRK